MQYNSNKQISSSHIYIFDRMFAWFFDSVDCFFLTSCICRYKVSHLKEDKMKNYTISSTFPFLKLVFTAVIFWQMTSLPLVKASLGYQCVFGQMVTTTSKYTCYKVCFCVSMFAASDMQMIFHVCFCDCLLHVSDL